LIQKSDFATLLPQFFGDFATIDNVEYNHKGNPKPKNANAFFRKGVKGTCPLVGGLGVKPPKSNIYLWRIA